MRILFLLSLCMCLHAATMHGQAKIQNKKRTTYLRIGDQMPDLEIKNISNYKTGNARISDFRGKLLILDFWGIYCTSCIAAVPKMEALQKTFGNKIQILMVTKNTNEEVEKLQNRIAVMKNIRLPMINNDKSICNLFSFNTIPTHVWIDGNGIVRQITDGPETTAENISKFLKGEKISLALKNEKKDFKSEEPLWMEGNGRQIQHLKYYSFIMERLPDSRSTVGPYFIYDSAKRKTGVKSLNVPILDLYRFAYNKDDNYEFRFPSYTLLEFNGWEYYVNGKNTSSYDDWANRNLFCYELKVDEHQQNKLLTIMQKDLEQFFGLRGRVEKRQVKCWVLKRTSLEDKLQPKDSAFVLELSPFNNQLKIKNYSLEDFLRQLRVANWLSANRFIDETNYKGRVELELTGDLTDIATIKRNLACYGLDIVEEEREIDMLVIKRAD